MALSINITAKEKKSASTVEATGETKHIITDKERGTFGIGDGGLKDAVEAYFGKQPNDAYLHSPTPWGDLYKRYNWPQVKLVLRPQSARITDVTTSKQALTEHEFDNDTDQPATFHADLKQEETETASSSWSETDTISVSQSINYGIEYKGASIGGETSMSYSHQWGRGGSESQSVTVGTTSGVSVKVDPHSSLKAVLSASKEEMKIRIKYRAHLAGRTAVNYNPTYRDHHFWGLSIRPVLQAAGKSATREFTEDMTLGYYTDAHIKLEDPSGEVVETIRLDDQAAPTRFVTPAGTTTQETTEAVDD
mgnify:CR=1 FL=1